MRIKKVMTAILIALLMITGSAIYPQLIGLKTYEAKALYESFPGYNIYYDPTWYDANVTTIQTNLNMYWGIYAGTPDGFFGDKTLNAVKIFQSENGLTVDGVVGRQTWYAICNP